MKKLLILISLFLIPNIVSASSHYSYQTNLQSYHLPIKYWYDNFDTIQSEINWEKTRIWSWEYTATDSFGETGYVWCEKTNFPVPYDNPNWWIINYTPSKFSGASGKWVVGYQGYSGDCECEFGVGSCYSSLKNIELRLFDGDIIADFKNGQLTTPIDSCSGSGGGASGVGILVFNTSLNVVEMYRVRPDGTKDYICSASIPLGYNPSGYIQLAVAMQTYKSGSCSINYVNYPWGQFDYIEWGIGEPSGTTTTVLGNITYTEAPTLDMAWFSSLCCERGCYFVPNVCYFLATIITLAISISIAHSLKSGISGIITSLILIIVFTLINFYPIWLGIVVSIILSFIIFFTFTQRKGG